MKWTHKSIRRLCRTLRRQGFSIGRTSVRRLLHQRKYCLRTNRKRLAGTHDKDRDRQFRYLVRQRHRYLKHGWPVISVDTKTKELVGNFKNPGRCWRRQERAVLDHDFRRYAVGVGIPYGIYDEGRNAGFVVLGVSHDTAAFAIAAIRQWWLQVGQKHYSKAKRWLIEADGGGSNGSSVFKCKTSRIGPSGPWPSGGCARSSSRSLATPDSSPGSIGPTDSSLTSVHRYAW
jgi:hypothetical protein